ncbi:MAG: hypothetical protein HY703_06200 [Gemmatimonadetes bacterium]|nr:hypothetical protein [Gemmatimonadota bacterium]
MSAADPVSEARRWLPYAEHAELTEWAVEAQDPGAWPEPTEEDARRAVEQARDVVDSVPAEIAHRIETKLEE